MPAQHNTSLELFSLYHLTRFLWLQSVSDVLYSVITVSNIEKIFVKHACISWSICWRNSVLVISHEWSPEQCLSIVWERRWLWWTRHARCWSQDTAERDNVEWHTSVRTRSLRLRSEERELECADHSSYSGNSSSQALPCSHHNHWMFLSDEECEHSMWRVGTTTSTPASDNIKSCRKMSVQKHVYSCANILHTFTGFFATGTAKEFNQIKS